MLEVKIEAQKCLLSFGEYEANDELMAELIGKIKVDKNLQVQFGIRDGVIDPVTKKVESTGELKKNI